MITSEVGGVVAAGGGVVRRRVVLLLAVLAGAEHGPSRAPTAGRRRPETAARGYPDGGRGAKWGPRQRRTCERRRGHG